jgi:hypothetical protein
LENHGFALAVANASASAYLLFRPYLFPSPETRTYHVYYEVRGRQQDSNLTKNEAGTSTCINGKQKTFPYGTRKTKTKRKGCLEKKKEKRKHA